MRKSKIHLKNKKKTYEDATTRTYKFYIYLLDPGLQATLRYRLIISNQYACVLGNEYANIDMH